MILTNIVLSEKDAEFILDNLYILQLIGMDKGKLNYAGKKVSQMMRKIRKQLSDKSKWSYNLYNKKE